LILADPEIDIPARCNCARIRRTARNITRSYDACMAPANVSANQFKLLGYLKHRGPMRMQYFSTRNLSCSTPLGRADLQTADLLERIGSRGHFAALEQPEIFVNELRAAFHKPLFREHLAESVRGKRLWLSSLRN